MRTNWQKNVFLAILLTLSAGTDLRAEIVSAALFSFPAKTEYVEYDNLAALRTLPNYNTLKQRFSGKPLEDAKAALGKLGIQEDQVSEIVVASSSKGFYGMATGTFSGESAAKLGQKKGYGAKVLESQVFCPAGEMCVAFLEDSLAAFGPQTELKNILEARQGIAGRLSSNRNVVSLLNNNTDRRSPVRGVVFGTQLTATVSDMLKDWSGWDRDWSRLSANVDAMAYSVKFDDKVHVSAALECTSKTAAVVLLQMLNALGSLQSAAAPAGKNSDSSMPFQHLQASSSGTIVDFKADTAMPGPLPDAR